mgnify:CR=1 FL=1
MEYGSCTTGIGTGVSILVLVGGGTMLVGDGLHPGGGVGLGISYRGIGI